MNGKKNDEFAQIALSGISRRGTELVVPMPPKLEKLYLYLNKLEKDSVISTSPKMSTNDELRTELKKKREQYGPYMRDLAPVPENRRLKHEIDRFDWRVETPSDKKNFSGLLNGNGDWKVVTIPHFGGPLGQAVTWYRTEFELSGKQLETGAIFLCCKGIDYKAHVFMNGYLLGSHEGFFAPFEFEFTGCAVEGRNILLIKVENDFICKGNEAEWTEGSQFDGDKIYAATGPGYDDPRFGWHHCPPGMGIYQGVYIEARSRLFINDIFVKPDTDLQSAEAWIELTNCDIEPRNATLELSLYGQNFNGIVFENLEYKPACNLEIGLGDSFNEARIRAEGRLNSSVPLLIVKGHNLLKIPMKMENARKWEPENPWLYQLQVKLKQNGNTVDIQKKHFGMRSFIMDTKSDTKGMPYLNGNPLRLRGANTMGHEQQCVMKKDWEQLRDDILLAKICNMNFLRLTQRPVQQEVYDFCDMLGLMTQTDLPLFGVLSRSQFCEGVRQAGEMERLVRSHPCNIMTTYINEPFPNANNKPQRNLTRAELEEFFKAADAVVGLYNPDRVTKHVDGDYDPPSMTLPDNHCYTCWYNGNGVDIGRLNKGYWMFVKPGWYYGCGEFGAEGLDPVDVMRKYYPEEWLPQKPEEEAAWSPERIRYAQSGRYFYFFFEQPETLEAWVRETQRHQAWAARIMTEAFRRDSHMVSFAIHLFIDAFPAGWMKSIMDVDRKPKMAYFSYRDALTPLMVNLRSDRFKFFSGEKVELEAWICNDRVAVPENTMLHAALHIGSEAIYASGCPAVIPSCSSAFQKFIIFAAPQVENRKVLTVKLSLRSAEGEILHYTELEIEVFPKVKSNKVARTCVIGSENSKAGILSQELGLIRIKLDEVTCGDTILVGDISLYNSMKKRIDSLVDAGSKAIFLELPEGVHEVGRKRIEVKASNMLPLHFAARNTGHEFVEDLKPDDFRLWYNPVEGYITPILENTFTAEGVKPILTSGNTNCSGEWVQALAAAEFAQGKGVIIISQIKMAGRLSTNPAAMIYASRLPINKN
jgi:hypothetical protein